MCLCNPAIKLAGGCPTAAHCTCSIRQILYMNRELTFLERTDNEPSRTRFTQGPFYRTDTNFQHDILLSSHQKHVDGFSRQRDCSPGFHYLASSALSSISATWQAMHTCMIQYLASRACTYRFCKLASSVRMDVQYLASSVQIRTCANFCTGSLGTHPKPRDRTSCELRVFTLLKIQRFSEISIPNEASLFRIAGSLSGLYSEFA